MEGRLKAIAEENHSEDTDFSRGSESGCVDALTKCDHLNLLSDDPLLPLPPPFTPCEICGSLHENWLCLCCRRVFCSRFVNMHMLHHYQHVNHCLALSFSDLSVWCFSCDAYLDAEVISQLKPVHQAAYLLKFGELPPLRGVAISAPHNCTPSSSV